VRRLGEPIHEYPDGIKLVGRGRQTHNEINADVFPFLGTNIQRLQQSGRSHMIGLDALTCVAFCNIVSGIMLHWSPPELRLQIMIHLCTTGVDGILGVVSFIKNLFYADHGPLEPQTALKPKSAFLIHKEIVNLRITFGQPPLNMRDSLITALSYNDFPSQHWGEGHIILSHVWRHSNAGFFPSDAESRQVVAMSFMTQGIRNPICLTGVIMNLKIVVFNHLQPPSLMHV
jgi:hypothetical protein